MKKQLLVSVGALLSVALVATVGPAAAQQVNTRAVAGWAKNLPFDDKFEDWVNRVNKAAAGKLRIDYVGGPEVYPSFEQLEPLRRGVVGVIMTSTAYVGGGLPEVNATWFGFGATPAQMREAGLVAALDQVTREKAGVTVLGLPLQMRFNVYLRKPIQRPADLKGFKLRSTPVYEPIFKSLGVSTVTVPPAELLTALESGIVDGFAWPAVAVTGPGYARAAKFKVAPSWWVGTDIALMNAKLYDSLPADVRKLITDTMIQVEREVPAFFQAKEKAEDDALAKMGIKDIVTSEADLKAVQKMHWDEGIQRFLLGPSPKHGPELVKIMQKFAPK